MDASTRRYAHLSVAKWYPSVGLRLSDDTGSGEILARTLTQEYAEDTEATMGFHAPRGHPSLLGRAPGGST